MGIQMIGIDHNVAGVRIRELFSFTATQAERAMEYIKEQPGVKGCVLLSTCNRTELYVSMEACEKNQLQMGQMGMKYIEMGHFEMAQHNQPQVGPTEMEHAEIEHFEMAQHKKKQPETEQSETEPARRYLLGLIGAVKKDPVEMSEFGQYFTYRQEEDAARHLFGLAAGLKSQILGEDQILAQVKEALRRSREVYCTDALLEVLFRYAVTAGKEVKAKIPSVRADFSAAHCAVEGLKRQGYVFAGKRCLVIGNGKMGKLAAMALQDEGADVTVTVRQYRSGMVEIPKGCRRIHYGERYGLIAECDLVISATVSPNLTIRKEELAQARGAAGREQIYIDLAVPRDIEEGIAEAEGITLYDIDSFQSGGTADGPGRQREAAQEILEGKLHGFWDWYACRELVPRMQEIGRLAAEDVCWRMGRGLAGFPQTEREAVGGLVRESSQKVVNKMLFALRDGMPREELYRCVELLEGIWGR